MIASQYFRHMAAGMVEQDEVLKQIEEVLLPANAPEYGLECHTSLIRLCQSLPLMEERILAAERADLRLHTIRQNQERIVIKSV